jgi:hypothetical protein
MRREALFPSNLSSSVTPEDGGRLMEADYSEPEYTDSEDRMTQRLEDTFRSVTSCKEIRLSTRLHGQHKR